MNHQQMQQRLETIQAEADSIKHALANVYPTLQEANPGDKLEDGCVVIAKTNDAVLVASPLNLWCKWCHWELSDEWFIPNIYQLEMAYAVAKDHFLKEVYWSTTYSEDFDNVYAFYVPSGERFISGKNAFYRAKPFKHIYF